MNESRQAGLMLSAIKDYQDGLMPLGMLVDKVEGILEALHDRAIKSRFFNTLLALEEVYARLRIGDIDFENDGRAVVDRAVAEMLMNAEVFLARSDSNAATDCPK